MPLSSILWSFGKGICALERVWQTSRTGHHIQIFTLNILGRFVICNNQVQVLFRILFCCVLPSGAQYKLMLPHLPSEETDSWFRKAAQLPSKSGKLSTGKKYFAWPRFVWSPEWQRCRADKWTLCATSSLPHIAVALRSNKFFSTFFFAVSPTLFAKSLLKRILNHYLNLLSLLSALTVEASSAETLQSIIMSSKTLEMGFTELFIGCYF